MKPKYKQILEKSVHAVLSAIEIYNKPAFLYREESFSILVINAWELLFKARILQLDGKNRIASIMAYEQRENVDGTLSKKLYRRKNRSGNHTTIGLVHAHHKIINEYGDKIDPIVIKNIELLTEIRDNAIHFYNKDFTLRKKIYEIGTASLKNYLYFVKNWFAYDLSQYQLLLMPIAFVQDIREAKGIFINGEEKNLLQYIRTEEKEIDDDVSNNVNLTLNIDLKFKRASSGDDKNNIIVTNSKDKDAQKVFLSEEDMRERYPWDYGILTTRLGLKYKDFKINPRYHSIRKKLEEDPKFCLVRYLDPNNKKSSKKTWYNPNIVQEFDKHYIKK